MSHDIKAGTGDAMKDDKKKRKKRTISLTYAYKEGGKEREKKRSTVGLGSGGLNPSFPGISLPGSFVTTLGGAVSLDGSNSVSYSELRLNSRQKRQNGEWENVEENTTSMPPKKNIEKIKNTFSQIFDAFMEAMGKVANAFRGGNNRNGQGQIQYNYESTSEMN